MKVKSATNEMLFVSRYPCLQECITELKVKARRACEHPAIFKEILHAKEILEAIEFHNYRKSRTEENTVILYI